GAGHAGPENVESISGEEFELTIASMLEKYGCECEMTAATGDQGADLIVHYKSRKIAVQVKRWAGALGNSAVQEVIAAQKLYRCDEAWVVTSSRFTKSAREVATAFGVVLVEGTDLGRLQSFLDDKRRIETETLFSGRPIERESQEGDQSMKEIRLEGKVTIGKVISQYQEMRKTEGDQSVKDIPSGARAAAGGYWTRFRRKKR